jgi:hypothetical protein
VLTGATEISKPNGLIALPGSSLGNVQIPGVPRNRILDKSEIPVSLERSIQILTESITRSAPPQTDWVKKAFEVVKGESLLKVTEQVVSTTTIIL